MFLHVGLGLVIYLCFMTTSHLTACQTDTVLRLFWFPRGQGLGRPWHLHTNENNDGKYVNLLSCGWLRQTVLFQKGQMLLWVITYGNWIHLTITIMAQYLTHACDVLYTLCSIREIDICLFAVFFWHWVTELRLSISVSKKVTWVTFTGNNRRVRCISGHKACEDVIIKWEWLNNSTKCWKWSVIHVGLILVNQNEW